jgi:hypothetical protein
MECENCWLKYQRSTPVDELSGGMLLCKECADDGAKHDVLYEAHQRIGQLEALNTLLAEQVDRMRPVVDAVKVFVDTGKALPAHLAYSHYEKQMAQLAKEGE